MLHLITALILLSRQKSQENKIKSSSSRNVERDLSCPNGEAYETAARKNILQKISQLIRE